MSDTVKITINDRDIEVDKSLTVLQACELVGVEIPRFCYHERLSVAGNCRMCLVEVSPGPPKPQASCALPVQEGQKINTHSPMAQSARHGVMEFLLVNHPLDCPICDQGGECDLQDQAMAYGRGISRYQENKRAVADKYMGPLIKPIMTRCIHCTRCVRFAAEVAGVEDIGLLNRGEQAEISTLEKAVHSELSGNLIDLCPVGALTSAPYAFTARSWELVKSDAIDVSSAEGANIRIDARGNEIMRVLPRLNEQVNEEWISDKARFACDGLKYQRLDRPYMKGGEVFKKKSTMAETSWSKAFQVIAKHVKKSSSNNIAAIAGDLQNVESLYATRLLLDSWKVESRDARQDGMVLNTTNRQNYLFNSGIDGIDECDALLIIGAEIRLDAPLINARIRRNWIERNLPIAVIGKTTHKLHYDFKDLGDTCESLQALANGDSSYSKILKAAKKPMLIVGADLLNQAYSRQILKLIAQITDTYNMISEDWNGYNVLHKTASRVGAMDIGFVPTGKGRNASEIIKAATNGELKILYLLGADELNFEPHENCLVIYQGHHGDKGASIADIILPSAAYAECDGIYVNLEGRVQMSHRAAFPKGDAREDWAIVRALSEYTGEALPFDDLSSLRHKLFTSYPHLRHIGSKPELDNNFTAMSICKNIKRGKNLNDTISLTAKSFDFYQTNTIARASKTMQECSNSFGADNV